MLCPILIDRVSADGAVVFRVLVPTLPGCGAEGKTIDEAILNAREAIARRLRSLREAGVPVPPLQSARRLLKELALVPGRTLHFVGIPTYRRAVGNDTWHYCRNCSHWPAYAFVEEYEAPLGAEICNECRVMDTNRICQP